MIEGAGIRTDRLLLRRWQESDAEPFAAMNADAEVMEYFPSTLTADESLALMNRADAMIGTLGYGWWACEVSDGHEFIGFVGLAPVGRDFPFGPAVEIGWRLARSHWGRGYATEAARACIAFGFSELGLDQIVSFTVPNNVRSRAVMERLGMTHDPGGDFDHPKIAIGHPLCRHVLYRLDAPAFA